MRKAFDKGTGPLADKSQPEAEREAPAHFVFWSNRIVQESTLP